MYDGDYYAYDDDNMPEQQRSEEQMQPQMPQMPPQQQDYDDVQ